MFGPNEGGGLLERRSSMNLEEYFMDGPKEEARRIRIEIDGLLDVPWIVLKKRSTRRRLDVRIQIEIDGLPEVPWIIFCFSYDLGSIEIW